MDRGGYQTKTPWDLSGKEGRSGDLKVKPVFV